VGNEIRMKSEKSVGGIYFYVIVEQSKT